MTREASRNFFVVTGGPGAGKTTLVKTLEDHGMAIAPEAGRAIILGQRAIQGPAGPDGDKALYAELMLGWEMRSYMNAAEASGLHIFDRGIPDTIGYLRLVRLPVPDHIRLAAETFRYNRSVFILPPWPEIYGQDSERKQSLKEAERTYAAMREIYTELGYRLVTVPPAPITERRDFVLEKIAALQS